MIDKQIQPIFQLCSYLLSYPDESFHSTLGEIEYELNQINHPALTKELYQFCEKAKKSHYIRSYPLILLPLILVKKQISMFHIWPTANSANEEWIYYS